jgi:hypothetical protein
MRDLARLPARAPSRGARPHFARAGAACLVLALAAATPRAARADEPNGPGEPRLLSETAEITSVVDAFDGDDPFDAHLMVGFRQSWKHANIRRETSLFQPGLSTGGFVARTENVATYSQSTSTLDLGADIGVFRDLALAIRLPLILSDTRELGDLDGSSANPQRLQDPSGGQLFTVPFKSPSRSGVDWFSVGLNYAILNQQRDFTKPTWVVGVEGRFAVGERLRACSDTPVNQTDASGKTAAVKCPDPASPTSDRSNPGISRGMHGIVASTVISRRYGYVEPYSGFRFLAEFPRSNTDFGATNDFQGSLVNHPPLQGTFLMGLEVVPWEHREQFQRLVADFRFSGTYVSPGREYSELFDALGSSSAASLRSPNASAYHYGPDGRTSVPDPAAQQVFFTGITDQQAYGSFRTSTEITLQVGEYVKFAGGVGLTYNQSHVITTADACNPDFKNDPATAGPCHAVTAGSAASQPITGIPNPNHRDVIDLPGRRFSVDDTTMVDLWIRGIVMF